MCWPAGSPIRRSSALVATGMLAAGCATPAVPVFPKIEPALVWPSPPETARIRWVGSLSGSEDLKAAPPAAEAFKAAFRGPRRPIRFSKPHSVAVESGGMLAVADGGLAGVHIIDPAERSHVLVTGWSDQRFEAPIGVCWAGRRIFVTDAARHEIIELDVAGRFRNRFGTDDLVRPVGIIYVADRDRLYVVDGGNHRIAVFDLAGKLNELLGDDVQGETRFNFPTHIATDGERILVADSANFRVQLLDLDGACLGTIGQKGDAAGDLALPKGVAFDSQGHLYVVDAHFENVQVFNDEGRLLLAFGREGGGRGEFSLPAGLAIDHNDRIWVADSGNHRIQVFDYLKVPG